MTWSNTKPKGEGRIDVQRVVRDCPHNDKLQGASGTIYDFDVAIDGELRAVWKRNGSHTTGYRLYAQNGDPIFATAPAPGERHNEYSDVVQAEKKADFVAILDGLFLSNRIPTIEDLQNRDAGLARAAEMAREHELELYRCRAVAEFSDELNEMTAALAKELSSFSWGQRFPGRNHALMDRHDALRARIDARVAELTAYAVKYGNVHVGATFLPGDWQ